MSERRRATKLGPVEILVVVCVWASIVAIITAFSRKSRPDAHRVECEKNLSAIGNAMRIYVNDYDGAFPRSGGRNSAWGERIPNWLAPNRYGAYNVSARNDGGLGTISSCFYLLVKYNDVALERFVCPGDVGATVFIPTDEGSGDRALADLWDFGFDPPEHCSYSYHIPFSLYALATSSDPGLALAADRNPWIGSRTFEAKSINLFMPDGGEEAIRIGNAVAHGEEGQNVLFVDGYVGFKDRAYCGINDDNIYTYWDGGDIRRGSTPTLGSWPLDLKDSLLVNDPPWWKR